MEIKLIIIALGLFFIIKNTKGVMLKGELASNYESPELVEKIPSIEPIINVEKNQIPNQCLLIPDRENNRIFVLSTTNGKDLISKRVARSWGQDEPLYVDEPRWIVIQNVETVLGNQKKHNLPTIEEPFYITRGKRLLKNRSSTSHQQSGINHQSFSLNHSLLDDLLAEDGLKTSKNAYKKINSLSRVNYVEPRAKNSDILGILHEPFFISRGKKYMGEHLKNTKHKFSDYDDSSLRDRRGEDFLEQLFKEKDPFYVTRGKKSDQWW